MHALILLVINFSKYPVLFSSCFDPKGFCLGDIGPIQHPNTKNTVL